MNSHTFSRLYGFLTLLCLIPQTGRTAEVWVQGETVYPVASGPIQDGMVWVRDGRIAAIGPADELQPAANATILRAKVVTPGLIDAHTTVGLSGLLNQDHDQEQVETSSPIQPELRAIDAYNGRDGLVDWVRQFGVTTIHTGHGPGALISGQTMIIKTDRESIGGDVMRPFAALVGALGEAGLNRDGSPGTRAKAAALLRKELLAAQDYQSKLAEAEDDKLPERNLRMEALVAVLDQSRPLILTAQRHQDILTAIRLAEEFDIRLILDGAAEAHLVLDDIQAAKVPVLIHPTMARPSQARENISFETASQLQARRIPFAQQSGYEPYVPKTRVVLFEAAMTLGYGLSFEAALRSITLTPAEILGIADRVGSLEVGKDADIALFDGDLFEHTSHCTGVLIDGRVVSETAH